MAKSFQQTQTAMACTAAAFCSGASEIGNLAELQAVEGGTPGSASDSFGASSATANVASVFFEIDPVDTDTWDAGDYVVRLNIDSANAELTWVATFICRLNSSCVNQETIGSLTGQSISLGTTGVKTMTVAGGAASPNAGDKIMIVCLFDAGGAHGNQTAGLIPDQLIDTPLTAAGGGGQEAVPDPAAATAAAIDPTTTIGGVTATPDPAAASAAAIDPSVTAGGVTAAPDPATATATAIDPSVTAGGVTATPDPATATATAIDPSITAGGITATPDPATATATAIDPSVSSGSAGPVVPEGLATANSLTGALQTASITTDPSFLYIAVVATADSTDGLTNAVTGLGLTWTLLDNQPVTSAAGSRSSRHWVWVGSGNPVDGTVQADIDNADDAVLLVFWVSGHDEADPIESQVTQVLSSVEAYSGSIPDGSVDGLAVALIAHHNRAIFPGVTDGSTLENPHGFFFPSTERTGDAGTTGEASISYTHRAITAAGAQAYSGDFNTGFTHPTITAFSIRPASGGGGGGGQVTPDPAVATAAAVDPTVTIGGVSSSPDPAVATAAAVDPTVTIGGVSAAPDPAIATAAAIDPSTELGGVTATPDPAAATAAAVDPTVTTGGEVVPAPATATATAIDPAVSVGGATATPDPAVAIAAAIDPLVSTGSVATPDPATATIAAIDPTVTTGGVVATPAPAIAVASAVDPAAVPGGVSVEPAPGAATATAIDPTASQAREAIPEPASSTAAAIDPTVTIGVVTATPAPAILTASAIDPAVTGGGQVPEAAFLEVALRELHLEVVERDLVLEVTNRMLRLEVSTMHYKQDEVGAPITMTLKDVAKNPIDLTGVGGVQAVVVKPSGERSTWALTVTDAASGVVSWTTVAGDLDEQGEYQIEAEIDKGGTNVDRAPSRGYAKIFVDAKL